MLLTSIRDASTPDNNFFISPHPRVPRLFFSTMGTWHGWNFLPILGEYTVSMLEGKLSDEEVETWSWDREMGKSKREIPSELKDIKGGGVVPMGVIPKFW